MLADVTMDWPLHDYARIRRPVAQEVLTLASRLTRLATIHAAPARILRNLVLILLNRVPSFKRKLTLGLSGLARRASSKLPEPVLREARALARTPVVASSPSMA